MKQIEVQILQQAYLLACPDGREARLLDAVERVDTAMTEIRDGGKVRIRDRIAVLAALNLAFDLVDRESADLERAAHPHSDSISPPHPEAITSGPVDGAMSTADHARLLALIERLDLTLAQETQQV